MPPSLFNGRSTLLRRRAMRLLYISEGNIPSKYAHTFQAMKMAEALSSHVRSLTLVTAGGLLGGRDEVDLFDWYGVRPTFHVMRLPVFARMPKLMGEGNHRRFTRAAAVYARLLSPNLVYTRSKQAARYCVKLGLKTILETHSKVSELTWRLRGAERHPRLIGLVTVTQYLRDEYVKAGVPANKILVWPDAVDLPRFQSAPPRLQARAELNLPLDRPIAMYCGHFYEAKGVPCLIEAAKLAPQVLFCFVGGWPDDIERMKQLAAGCSNVRFLGFVANDQVPRHLAAADVLVLPNSARTEHARATSPLKLFEYMAAKRPVVATKIPALHGFLRHRENSFLVEPDSPESLAIGMRSLLDDRALASRIAGESTREVAQFTWSRRAADILNHFGLGQSRQARPAA